MLPMNLVGSLTRRRPIAAFRLLLALAVLLWPSFLSAQATSSYADGIEAWRAAREAELRTDEGWLTLVGLSWLDQGRNTVGSAPDSAVRLPATAPATVGTIVFNGAEAHFSPAPGSGVLINGQPASAVRLRPQPGQYDTLSVGTISFFVIQRGTRFGVRIRDTASPARRDFHGLVWFPIAESYRVRARFVPHPTPVTMSIPNVLGEVTPWSSPGYVVFTLGGRELRLHPVLEGENARELFFIIRDATTGKDTYPGGRFLYADVPRDGEVVLDFNKAISPPCAFTAFATCPLPPKENALPVRIEAGEKDPHK
jgi:hypothetical protein